MPGKAIALLSAGLDSSIATALSMEKGVKISLALTFNYGQKAAKKEAEQAKKLAKFYKVTHKVIALPWFRSFQRGGALLTSAPLPKIKINQLEDRSLTQESAKRVWIPNRNGVFIEIAAAFAENNGSEFVIVGFNKEEAATFPDNSRPYLAALDEALAYSTSNKVRILSPTAVMDKKQIVHQGRRLNFPFHLLWSCYQGKKKMCGECESCQRLKRSLCYHGVLKSEQFTNATV